MLPKTQEQDQVRRLRSLLMHSAERRAQCGSLGVLTRSGPFTPAHFSEIARAVDACRTAAAPSECLRAIDAVSSVPKSVVSRSP